MAVWCFSKKDFLPRSRRNIYPLPDGTEMEVARTLTNLVASPPPTPESFAFDTLPGYKRTDEPLR